MGKEIQINGIFHNIKEYVVSQDGHRYDEKEKAFALTMYKTMGKRAYTCLREVFRDIPSIKTLQLALHRIPFTTGINPFILSHLKKISPNMSLKNKVRILMWDEVSIQPSFTYDTRKDIIYGFEDWSTNRTAKTADHALVFMLRGINSGWKMPISYSFCNKQTKTAQLLRCIKKHIRDINKAGFNIV
ncbi:uncharacterized protein LOC118646126 [Monomorium pharaonis]|uniref:uncharacterized protein LOC118646126 n=1 Tax=Monomorium pharaonis TaxID=307658 RepID=UPI001747A9E9|nr:uncharacterized protein LOC118646126 [Monomorium pharaonis]